MKIENHGIVLFDGVCNLCNSSVNFIMDHDRADYFRFGSLQSDRAVELLEQYSLDRTETDSVILIEEGKAYTYSTAALKIARRIGGVWSLAYLFIVIPKILRDPFYKLIAKNRYSWFGKREMCRLPSEAEVAKFI